jgi:sugar phosphate isomerase/epimerase
MPEAKICRGSWCLGFGFERPATLEQVVKVLSAFEYDGIELAGFFDHVTLEKYPDKASRKKLVEYIHGHDLELAGYAPGPYGDFGRLPWATGPQSVLDEYMAFFEASLQLCVDCGIEAMRIDPGDFGPLPRDADYDAVWDRVVTTFRKHAERGAEYGITMLWELETGQLFHKASEAVKLFEDVNHPNLKLMYDFGHVHASIALAHNQLQPVERLAGGHLEFIKLMKGRIGHMHVCDNDNNTWQNAFGTHLAIGQGVLDFDALFPAIVDSGYTGKWWAVDTVPMGPQAWADTWTDKFVLDALLDKHVRNR